MYINIVNHHKAWKLLESDVDLQDRLRTAFSSAPWWGWAVGLIGTALRNRPRWLWLVPPPGSALPSRRISECSGWFLCPPLIVGPVRIRMINDDHKPYFITHVCLSKYLYNNLFWALKQNFLQQYIKNWSYSCLVSMTPTLLIPRSEIYFQTSSRGVNEAFLWAIGSDFASLAAAAYNYHKGMLIDKIKFSIFDE